MNAAARARTGARRALRRWFATRRRAYPWRGTGDLWKALAAEVMLHQTRASRATPAWERFVSEFPTPCAFARADDDAVRRAWSGLGFYARGFRLRDAARALAASPHPPRSSAELRALPGVGPYTTAILASTLWGEPVAAVDGNVARVVARLDGVRARSGTRAFTRAVQAAATRLLDARDAGAWNEALMDLGRVVCTSAAPACGTCPLRSACVARRKGRASRIPAPRRARARRTVHVAVGIVVSPDGVLVERRPVTGLLARQDALPTGEGRTPAAAHGALERRLAALLGLPAPGSRAIGTDRHVFTHRIWNATAYRVPLAAAVAAGPGARWVPLAGLAAVPLPSLYRRLADAHAASGGRRVRARAPDPSLKSAQPSPAPTGDGSS